MKGFKDFMETKKYVAVIYDDKTQKLLRKWCKENGFDLTKKYSGEDQKEEDFDFHTTIFFTSNELHLKNEEKNVSPSKVTITGMEMLGLEKDIPVFKVESEAIMDIRKKYEDMGLEDVWDEYIPHISVSYDKKQRDLEALKLPVFDLYFDKIVIDDGAA